DMSFQAVEGLVSDSLSEKVERLVRFKQLELIHTLMNQEPVALHSVDELAARPPAAGRVVKRATGALSRSLCFSSWQRRSAASADCSFLRDEMDETQTRWLSRLCSVCSRRLMRLLSGSDSPPSEDRQGPERLWFFSYASALENFLSDPLPLNLSDSPHLSDLSLTCLSPTAVSHISPHLSEPLSPVRPLSTWCMDGRGGRALLTVALIPGAMGSP
ncbi:unnamed protein product, partial [Pleuronectes platessa]